MQWILWMLRDLVVSLALASVLVAVPVVRAQTSEAPAPPRFRLRGDVAGPLRYAVDLTVIPDADTFTGTVDRETEGKGSNAHRRRRNRSAQGRARG